MREPSQKDLTFAKIDDKIKFCNSKNKITHTDFFTEPEVLKIDKYLKSISFKRYFFFGGTTESNRKILFFFPEKLNFDMAFSNVNLFLNIIRITLPNSLINSFEHRDYLSAIMKFGIVREKFGDIIVYDKGADIIVQKENSEYFKENLSELIRFKKSNIEILDISQVNETTPNLEEISIIVNSMRIDNFVTEIAHCSRNKAEELLLSEKVMINYEIITKNSKLINFGDILNIRGFGRFIVKENTRTTKNNKLVITLLHNC